MEVARPECEEDGASDVEVFFTSQEEAKPLELDNAFAQF
ncbi:hypothetical protein COE15_24105 [Bacillus cereus]|nr:hypothetical protein CN288_14950 [Bacillus sp. AFS023182]PGX92465.1 hypothetical protein COE15_24105 [Bacillus cereus]